MSLRAVTRALRDARRFARLPAAERAVVFYAEDASAFGHLGAILEAFAERRGRPVCYLTSSASDPVLTRDDPRVRPFYVGAGWTRTWVFAALEADVMVLTMPDLETFHLKRSRARPTHYVYVFHSIVSTHMIYRPTAFDHYDSVLCVGPHHVAEIRAREARYGLPRKELVAHGYHRLEAIRTRAAAARPAPRAPGAPLRVLVAPSWGPHCLLEAYGPAVVDALLGAGMHVTVRPHPMTMAKWPAAIAALQARIARVPEAVLETDVASQDSLHQADVMISDWSGAALEYAFGLERPVVFVDVPRKVNNPDYAELGLEPVEASLRAELGTVVAPDALGDLPGAVRRLAADPAAFRERVRAARARTVFNLGHSGAVGAEHLARVAAAAAETGRA